MLRAGASLVELLVAIVMLGVISGAVTSALTQQERVRARVVARLAGEAQLREAMAPVVADLGAASPAAGDFDVAMATEATLEVRVTIAEAHACGVDEADSTAVYAMLLSSMRGRSIAAGDSAWLYHAGVWAAAPVVRVSVVGGAAGTCTMAGSGGPAPLRVVLGRSIPIGSGTAVRFTRRVRYSLYRGGDGYTYLGLREWSATLGALAAQQPVAGPLDPQGSRFRYADSLGNEVATPVGNSRLAQVRLELAALGASHTVGGAAAPRLMATIALRNRR